MSPFVLNPYRFATVGGVHQWWRIVQLGEDPLSTSFTAMAFKDDTGATISTSGGTPLDSGHSGSNTSSNLFDNNDTTRWDSTSGNLYQTYVGIQFSTTQKVRQIGLQVSAASQAVAAPLPNIFVQVSDDGLTWATVAVVITGSFVNDTMKWFDFTGLYPSFPRTDFGSHPYWRFRAVQPGVASGGGWCGVSAMLFKDDGGSAIATTGGTALASGHDGSFVEANAFDSNDATAWASTNISILSYLGYQFSSPKKVMQVGLQRHASQDGVDPPVACTFEYSDDGVVWAIAVSVVTGTFTNDVPIYYNLATGL